MGDVGAVTAKLSREFYERFGDEIVDELVGLLNTVDAVSRDNLRELNELNFARFDAKLEQRIAELRAELRTELRTGLSEVRNELRNELVPRMDQLSARVEQRIDYHGRLLLLAWVTQLAVVIGLGTR
jgi:hypothetical protein